MVKDFENLWRMDEVTAKNLVAPFYVDTVYDVIVVIVVVAADNDDV